MQQPLISVVTPSYNQGKFLERTILSVLNQNYPDIEYIIIDGGSTDNSIEIIKKYEKYLSYWVSEPDKGQADAINKGFSKATGDILAWINSDDMYLPNAFHIAAETFIRNQDASIVYGDYIKVNEEDRCVALRRQPSFDYRTCLYAYLTVMQPASFFSRKAFLNTGGLDISFNYALDFDIILSLAKQGRVVHIREYLAAFRLHSSSKSVSARKKFRPECIRIRIKNLGRRRTRRELAILFRIYEGRAILRMIMEGCIPSRFGWDRSNYKLSSVYTPESIKV
jgi:glycosyltransferase involved in cell wall biosynthesis